MIRYNGKCINSLILIKIHILIFRQRVPKLQLKPNKKLFQDLFINSAPIFQSVRSGVRFAANLPDHSNTLFASDDTNIDQLSHGHSKLLSEHVRWLLCKSLHKWSGPRVLHKLLISGQDSHILLKINVILVVEFHRSLSV